MPGMVYLRYPFLQVLGALGLGIVLAAIGPYGTFSDLPLGPRLGYWITIVALNWLQIVAVSEILAQSRFAGPLPVTVRALLAAGLASIPATFEVAWLEQYFRNSAVPNLASLYGQVLILTIAVTLPLTLLLQRRSVERNAPVNARFAVAAAPPAAPASEPAPSTLAPQVTPFARRIPAHLGPNLLALEMEDHYLRVHTDRGSDLILCRFGDALAELAATDGLQVHRSWWVARTAVSGSQRRESGKLILTLRNGLQVPVSRSYTAAIRNAGWLSG